MIDVEDHRQDFEVAYTKRFSVSANNPHCFERYVYGTTDYTNIYVRNGWEIWKACIKKQAEMPSIFCPHCGKRSAGIVHTCSPQYLPPSPESIINATLEAAADLAEEFDHTLAKDIRAIDLQAILKSLEGE